jgi:Mg-chelatase subunit ChlD
MELNNEQKWRLILGQSADEEKTISLDSIQQAMDAALEALYDSQKKGGLGNSSPQLNRWLKDIRTYFPTPVVQVMQRDAIERLELKELLLEPEILDTIVPDVHLVGTLLTLNQLIPEKTKSTARAVIQKIVKALEEQLYDSMRSSINNALRNRTHKRNPKWNEIDWHKTINRNLKNYQTDLQKIIPEYLIGFSKKGRALKDIILLIDQSGSMMSSLVYASVLGAILASLRTIKTHFVVFDTTVVDLTQYLDDPVDLLFGTQLGGGTDIAQAMTYAKTLVQSPTDTILVLISDLYEGGNTQQLLQTSRQLKDEGVQVICLLALDDEGAPSFNRSLAAAFNGMDIPSFACTPNQFPALMAAAINQQDLSVFQAN